MMNWPVEKLGDHIEVLTDYHANGSYKVLKENVELLDDPDYAVMIRTTNFEKEDFSEDLKYINQHAYEFLKKSRVCTGDILMNKIANAGSVYLMPELNRPVSLAMNLFLIRIFSDRLDQTFAYYYLKANEAYIKSFATGSTTTTITKKAVRNLDIVLPPMDTQRKIVDTIYTYQALIENNKRRIELLEESARQLYKEWFVRFRFPGHEHVKIIDGVPEGWLVNNLGSFVNIAKGKNITKNTVVHGEIPVVAGGLKPAYYHNKANTKGPVITVSASGANAGYVNLYHEDVWASDCSYIESEGELSIPFYYLMLKERQSEITLMQKGAAQPHVYPKDLMRLVISMPPKLLLEQFTDLVAASFNLIKVLELENKQLAYARDLLLPKLMNGEIAV